MAKDAVEKAHILAQIAKLGADIYGVLVDKDLKKKEHDKDRKIAELEAQLAELKKQIG